MIAEQRLKLKHALRDLLTDRINHWEILLQAPNIPKTGPNNALIITKLLICRFSESCELIQRRNERSD